MDNLTSAKGQRVSAEERSRFISFFRQSGLTQAEFARQQGINVQSLRQWLYRAGGQKRVKPTFQELPVGALLSPGWAAEVVLLSGMTLRLGPWAKPELISFLLQNLGPFSC